MIDYVGRGTAGQGDGGGEEVHRYGGCVAQVGIEGVGTGFQRINGGVGGDLSDEAVRGEATQCRGGSGNP